MEKKIIKKSLNLQDKFFELKKRFIKIKKFIFIDDKVKKIISINDGSVFSSEAGSDKGVYPCIISDSLLEIKVINIPVVSKSILKNIIINTLKKHSTVKPTLENTDFIILGKEQNQFEILTFISLNKELLGGYNKKFSLYHIISLLSGDPDFPENASFITDVDGIWFLYSFKKRKFSARHIYYSDDISALNKKRNIFHFSLFAQNEKNKKFKFSEIPSLKIKEGLLKLNNGIFKNSGKNNIKRTFIIISAVVFFMVFSGMHFYFFKVENKKKQLAESINILNKKYEQEKSKRGISDEAYKEYLKLFSKKSYVNNFFKSLYYAGNNNIGIERFSFNENNFTVSGYCKDDSKLETEFRKSGHWKDVNFTFTKKNDKIIFNISGKFINAVQ